MIDIDDMDDIEKFRLALAGRVMTVLKDALKDAASDRDFDINEALELEGDLKRVLQLVRDLGAGHFDEEFDHTPTQKEAEAAYCRAYRRGMEATWKTPLATQEKAAEYAEKAAEEFYWNLDYFPYTLSIQLARICGYRDGTGTGHFFTYAWDQLTPEEKKKHLAPQVVSE